MTDDPCSLLDRDTEMNLYTLLGFHPDSRELGHVLSVVRQRGWTVEPYLLAALLCRLWSAGGDRDEFMHRTRSYSRRGGYDLRHLGLE